mmetsp:Transcript_9005/g.22202  ORF Transcript_9005/g.22202 Transcript_9005/m.22202 type:complete len:251 (+) Transcript_9005:1928-2680(+)
MFLSKSQRKGSASPICSMTNLLLHLTQIFKKVSQAMSCTPSNFSCMNSKSLFTTVLRNFQCCLKKRGYWPTTYMMLEAMTALLSFPLVISHRLRRSLITVTKNLFSCSSAMVSEIEPMAQHSVLSRFQDHSLPLSCRASFSSICDSVSSWSRWLRYTSVSLIILYCTRVALSFIASLTMFPFSSSTMMISSGLAILQIMRRRSLERIPACSTLRETCFWPPLPLPPKANWEGRASMEHSEEKMSHTKTLQ